MAEIQEYLDDIKNAVYGKEVRQSIHDSIQAMNEEIKSSDAIFLKDDMNDTNVWLNRASNILNKNTLTENYYVDGGTGKIIANTSFLLSDYTNVADYESIWVCYGISHFAFYDANKTFISGISRASAHSPSAVYKIPTNAVYGRFSVYIDDVAIAMVGDGSKALENTYIKEEALDETVSNRYGIERNLLDKNTITEGYYVADTNGQLYSNSSFSASDYIDVSSFGVLGISDGVGKFAYYDSNKDYVSGVAIISANHSTSLYEVPSSVKYARFSIHNPQLNSARISGYEDAQSAENDIFNIIDSAVRHTFYVDVNGNGDFTSLTECINKATNYMDSVVYVAAGVYDLESEFKALYGDTFFSSYTSTTSNKGIVLQNRIHLIFDSRALVKFNYNGSNSAVVQYFAPFNSGKHGFTLENLTIDAKNCRYNVHDERGGSTDHYVNKYLNCDFRYSTINTSFPQCIGGGLGSGGEVIIKDCVFDSASDRNITVSYHNNNLTSATDSKSRIVFTGNMIKNKGTLRITYMGNSQKMTTVLATNNSFGSEPYMAMEGTDAPYENTEIIGWNNVVRTE